MKMQKITRTRLLAGGVLLTALTFAAPGNVSAQEARQEAKAVATDVAPQIWTLKFKKGGIAKYRTKAALTGKLEGTGDVTGNMEAMVKHEVKELSDSGDITILMKTETQKLTFNGAELPDDPSMHFDLTTTYNKGGLLVKHKVDNELAGAEQLTAVLAMLSSFPVPEKAVKAGDSWKTEASNRILDGKKVLYTSTLVGGEKVSGIDTLRVKFEVPIARSEKSESDLIKVTGTYNVDPKEGRLVQMNYTVEGLDVMAGGAGLKLKIEATTALIVPGVNDKDVPKVATDK